MLKVEIFYKVIMFDTDWLMSEAEYKEFIATAQQSLRPSAQSNEPVVLDDIPWHGAKSHIPDKDKEIHRLWELLQVKDAKIDEMNVFYEGRDTKRIMELEREAEKKDELIKQLEAMIQMNDGLGIVNSATKTDKKSCLDLREVAAGIAKSTEAFQKLQKATSEFAENIEKRQEEECPDFIEPPEETKEIEIVEQPKDIEKPREINYDFPKKNRVPRDYTKYIQMYIGGAEQKVIEETLVEDFGITPSTATQSYYSKVRPRALKQIEAEKVIIIDEDKPAPGKFFTDAERARIQKAVGIR